jgi:hypothetical protein
MSRFVRLAIANPFTGSNFYGTSGGPLPSAPLLQTPDAEPFPKYRRECQ